MFFHRRFLFNTIFLLLIGLVFGIIGCSSDHDDDDNFLPPTVLAVTPSSGPAQEYTPVTILGSGFRAAPVAVTVNGVQVFNLHIVNDVTITCSIPPGTPGPATIFVQTSVGKASLPNGFLYLSIPPEIDVTYQSQQIVNGSTFPSLLNGTDFGNVSILNTRALLDEMDVTDSEKLLQTIQTSPDKVSSTLRENLSPNTRAMFMAYSRGPVDADLQANLVKDINALCSKQKLYGEEQKGDMLLLNRREIENAYPGSIEKLPESPFLFTARDIANPVALLKKLQAGTDSLSTYLQGNLAAELKELSQKKSWSRQEQQQMQKTLAAKLNDLMQREPLVKKAPAPSEKSRLHGLAAKETLEGSRIVLEEAYGDTIAQATRATLIHVFTVRNLGLETLVFGGGVPFVNIVGDPAFAVTLALPSAIVSGGSADFAIAFTPVTVGLKTATVTIASNDPDESLFTFAIQGTGTAPEISVIGNGVEIVNGDTTPSLADHTDFGNADLVNVIILRTFTIQNNGNTTLNLSGGLVTLSGANAADFAIISLPIASIPAGGNSSFQIAFDPSAEGVRTATVTIPNDDQDENPYTFAIQGTGTTPEINLIGNDNNIANGDNTPSLNDFTDFGNVAVGGNLTRTFTIQNNGSGTLELTNTPIVTVIGGQASEFTIATQPTASIAAGSSSDFQVTFTPTAIGLRRATILIKNNDLDEDPYIFAIQGTGTSEPEMDIQGNGVSIVDGDTTPSTVDDTDFGNFTGTPIVKNYTIFNTGLTPLNLTGTPLVSITGANAGDFTVTDNPDTTVAPTTGSTTFQITFVPSANGVRTATVSIANDDSDENPYDFAIQGNAGEPEIEVRGNTVVIVDGDTTPTTEDHTDFGNYVGTAIVRTFLIYNVGPRPLNLTGNPLVVLSGANAADFAVTSMPSSTIAQGNFSSFQVTFSPAVGSTGTRNRYRQHRQRR